MKVHLKYRGPNGEICQEVTELIEIDKVRVQGTDLWVPLPAKEGWTVFEDDQGLWGVPNEDIIEMKPFRDIPEP